MILHGVHLLHSWSVNHLALRGWIACAKNRFLIIRWLPTSGHVFCPSTRSHLSIDVTIVLFFIAASNGRCDWDIASKRLSCWQWRHYAPRCGSLRLRHQSLVIGGIISHHWSAAIMAIWVALEGIVSSLRVVSMPVMWVHLWLQLVEIHRLHVVHSVSRSGLLNPRDALDRQIEDDLGTLVGDRG